MTTKADLRAAFETLAASHPEALRKLRAACMRNDLAPIDLELSAEEWKGIGDALRAHGARMRLIDLGVRVKITDSTPMSEDEIAEGLGGDAVLGDDSLWPADGEGAQVPK